MRKNRTILAAAIALTVLLGTACAPPGQSNSASETDTLRVGVHGPTLVSIHPAKVLRTGSQSIVWSVYSRLTQIDGTGTVVPDFAEDWNQVDDVTWIFDLKDNYKFENDVALDVDVVLWNFEKYLDPNSDWTAASTWRNQIKSVTAEDENSIRIETTKPFLALPNALSSIFFLEPSWFENHNPDIEALGSGPYRLESYQSENRGVLTASETYAGEKPEFENIEINGYSESETRLAALKNDEIDLTITIDPIDLATLENQPDLIIGGSGGQRVQTLQLNFNVEPFQDQRVREALNYAIDRKSITESIYKNTTVPNKTQVISQFYLGYDSAAPEWDYDLEKAKVLLEEAGYADGFSVDVNVPTGTYAGAEQAIQVIAESWKEIGVDLKIEVLPSGPWGDKNTTSDIANAPDIIYWGIQNPYLDGANGNFKSWTSGYRENDGELENHAEYNEIVDRLAASENSEQYEEIALEASNWLRENAALVYLWDQPQTYAYSESISWEPRFDDWIDYQSITKNDEN